ncbi:hypothetical protein D3C78_1351680 [compost metagenome]
MSDFQRCQLAATAPACPKKVTALEFTTLHLAKFRAAGTAFRHLSELHGEHPEWRRAYAEWQRLAEETAVVVLAKLEALEGSPQ